MKTIIQYKTDDGKLFDSEDGALAHEQLVKRVKEAMAPLGSENEDVKNGKGWVQHDLETVIQCKQAILDICKEQNFAKIHPEVFNTPAKEIHPLSFVGRVLSDYGGPLNKAWYRFCKIDKQGREHQQPYYAYTAGPDQSRHRCVEDRRKEAQG